MASKENLAQMQEIAKKFDYEIKRDKNVKTFPLITYATKKIKPNKEISGDAEIGDTSIDEILRNDQHIKALFLAMRCNIPVDMFDTHVINLCKWDDSHDLDNLEKGDWLKHWNGTWILQSHGTRGAVKIDEDLGATRFYDSYGKYILDRKNFKVGLLKTCYAADKNPPPFDKVLCFSETLRAQRNDKEIVLIGATAGTTVSPLYANKNWGLPILFINDILNYTDKNKGSYENCFKEAAAQLLQLPNSHMQPDTDPVSGLNKSLIYAYLTDAFYEQFSLNPNHLIRNNPMNEKQITEVDKDENALDDNNNDQEEEKEENVSTKDHIYSLIDPRVQEQSKQDKIGKAKRHLYWYKTGPELELPIVISNIGVWNLVSKSPDKKLYKFEGK